MMSISVSAISETLDPAFRAAFLLTGRADVAENAVLDGIDALQCRDDVEKTLVAKTIESVIRQRAKFPKDLEQALAHFPEELHRLILLAPVSRDCFMLRILFGIRPENCAAILNLTSHEFEEALYVAFQQLSMPEAF
jgi:hypothetical protein